MAIFFLLLYILFALTALFYLVFFGLVYYWHEKDTTFVVVPIVFTFEFFVIGFLVISIISLAVQYLPTFLNSVVK